MSSYLIAGAGLFGATCARLLADAGHRVLVVEARPEIGGNCADELVDGILCNRHGGHIFHTNSERVWNFARRFTDFRQYEHRVKACYQGRLYPMPPNRATLDLLGMEAGEEAERAIVEMFYDGYSLKQWGKPFGELPASVQKRVTARHNYDDRYFPDRWQGLPEDGYSALIGRMLDGIPTTCGVPYTLGMSSHKYERVIYSGPIDALFDYRHGRLEYRSLRYQTETLAVDDYQGCATVNYTEAAVPWMRILEWKHFGWRYAPKGITRVTMEYPADDGEPYYPVENEANREIYRRYAEMVRGLPWLHAGGRLGSYRYINMDQAIAAAMALVDREVTHGTGI